jgi:tripartite-type tricarboxylate transporter receptor subunit TctC
VLHRLYEELKKALDNPAVTQKLTDQGMDIVGGTPQELDRFLRGEIARWAKVVNENKIRAGD